MQPINILCNTVQIQKKSSPVCFGVFFALLPYTGITSLRYAKPTSTYMETTLEQHQYTLRQPAFCTGIGLHSGQKVRIGIYPAPVDSGISFVRTDLSRQPVIPARYDLVGATMLATRLSEGQTQVSTVEHLMATLRGLGIDNARVTVDNREVPIMDGSAWPFVEALQQAGRSRQDAERRYLRITRPLEYREKGKSMRVEPDDDFNISCTIDFEADLIKTQHYDATVNRRNFIDNIAKARTFGYVEQVEELWQNGLALGGSLDNVVAIHWDRRSVLNEGGLRYQDEFVRHKILDLIGDAALAGAPILGHITATCSGHSLHQAFLRKLFANPDCWDYVTCSQMAH